LERSAAVMGVRGGGEDREPSLSAALRRKLRKGVALPPVVDGTGGG